jgi:hypothetical protein
MMGALGDQIGAPSAALLSGIGCLIVVLINQLLLPEIHQLT